MEPRRISKDDVPSFGQEIAGLLKQFSDSKKKPFVLWMVGDLGTGKTTTVREILYGLGVARNVPVLSPTFTYLTEYKSSSGALYAHADLYRLIEGDVDSVHSLFEGRRYDGVFVEWPERASRSEVIASTHVLTGSIADETTRVWHLTES